MDGWMDGWMDEGMKGCVEGSQTGNGGSQGLDEAGQTDMGEEQASSRHGTAERAAWARQQGQNLQIPLDVHFGAIFIPSSEPSHRRFARLLHAIGTRCVVYRSCFRAQQQLGLVEEGHVEAWHATTTHYQLNMCHHTVPERACVRV